VIRQVFLIEQEAGLLHRGFSLGDMLFFSVLENYHSFLFFGMKSVFL
jgi:hypothetical protein